MIRFDQLYLISFLFFCFSLWYARVSTTDSWLVHFAGVTIPLVPTLLDICTCMVVISLSVRRLARSRC